MTPRLANLQLSRRAHQVCSQVHSLVLSQAASRVAVQVVSHRVNRLDSQVCSHHQGHPPSPRPDLVLSLVVGPPPNLAVGLQDNQQVALPVNQLVSPHQSLVLIRALSLVPAPQANPAGNLARSLQCSRRQRRLQSPVAHLLRSLARDRPRSRPVRLLQSQQVDLRHNLRATPAVSLRVSPVVSLRLCQQERPPHSLVVSRVSSQAPRPRSRDPAPDW